MKKNRLIAGALALALLAGCSGGGGKLMADADDIAYQAADIRRDAELFTVNGAAIPAEEYLFLLVYAIQVAQQYGQITDDASWNEKLGDGTTMTEALKADALESAKLYQVVEDKAEELGVTITAEQQEGMDQQLQQFIEHSVTKHDHLIQ